MNALGQEPIAAGHFERILAWWLRAAVLATAVWHAMSGDAVLFLFCVLGLAVLLIPPALARNSGANVPVELELGFLVLLVTDMTLGKVAHLYARLAWWDKALHLGNSLILAFLGFLVLYVLRTTDRVRCSASMAVLLTAWLTLGLGAAWEILEFGADELLGTAAQGSPVMASLRDTMWDLVLDLAGGVLGGVLGIAYVQRSRRARRVARWFSVERSRSG